MIDQNISLHTGFSLGILVVVCGNDAKTPMVFLSVGRENILLNSSCVLSLETLLRYSSCPFLSDRKSYK